MNIIIDYQSGNIRSLANALESLKLDFKVSSDPKKISNADRLICPGQGHIGQVMESFRKLQLVNVLRNYKKPFLGICVGMQMLYESSEEGSASCLGIIPGEVKKFPEALDLKTPHMGWNQVSISSEGDLFKNIPNGTFFAYAHSYSVAVGPNTTATTEYGIPFSAASQSENFFGVQFHPEKSGLAGLQLLKNFFDL